MSTVSPERVNASRLLDHNLDAGRADKPAIAGDAATLTYGELARLTARTGYKLCVGGKLLSGGGTRQ